MDLFGNIEFREPWFLWACLIALPVFVLAHSMGGKLLFSSFRLLPDSSSSWRTRMAWFPGAMLALGALSLAIALAGPRTADRHSRIVREGIAIMMVVDTSGSMRALDLRTEQEELTRLDAVKQVFEDFVLGSAELNGRPDDTIGLVAFAGYADTRCPLTLDHDNLITIARSLEIVSDPAEDGTAIGDGLGLAVERLRESKASSRVAILLTDGIHNSGVETPLAAAELARTVGVRVYTVGAGTNGLANMRVENPFTGGTRLRQVPVEIDEKTLKAIAERTGGRYFRATSHQGLQDVYREIDKLERTRITEDKFREYSEHYRWFVAIAMVLIALAWLMRGTILRRLP